MKKVIIIGAGGHGKVIADIIEKSEDHIVGFLDDRIDLKFCFGYPILGNIDQYNQYSEFFFILAIGDNFVRSNISQNMKHVKWYTAIHPSAVLAKDVKIGAGTAVMANAVINSSAIIGQHCIINSAAIVEHDNMVGDFVHISPRVALGGTVHIGSLSHLGIGSTVKNNVSICSQVIIGAAGCVIHNISHPGTYVGVPVKQLLPGE